MTELDRIGGLYFFALLESSLSTERYNRQRVVSGFHIWVTMVSLPQAHEGSGIRFNFRLFVPHLSPKDTYPSQLVHLGSQTAKPCRAAQQKKHTCRSQMRIASNSATPITCKQGQCEFGARRTRLYRAENRGRRALRGTGNLRCLMKLTWTFTTHQA